LNYRNILRNFDDMFTPRFRGFAKTHASLIASRLDVTPGQTRGDDGYSRFFQGRIVSKR